jgi:hypothetical protein
LFKYSSSPLLAHALQHIFVQINFQLAVALPAPCPTLKVLGQLSKEGTIVFDGPKRFILSADAVETLRVRF